MKRLTALTNLRRLRLKVSRSAALAATSAALLSVPLVCVEKPSMAALSIAAWFAALATALTASCLHDAPGPGAVGFALSAFGKWVRSWEGAGVAALLVAGGALRLYGLESFPTGIHGDEAEFALIAEQILQGAGPAPFGTAFLGDPALFFYLEAPFLAVLGHNVNGMRIFAALAGTLTLPAFYLLVRRMFGARSALLALAALTTSAVHIHFSRLGINSAGVLPLTCIAAYGLWQAYETRRPVWWLTAGVFGALPVYFHFAGRAIPLVIGAFFVYLIMTESRLWRDWWQGAALVLVGNVITLAPLGRQLASHPEQLTGHMTSRLVFADWEHATNLYHTSSVWQVLLEQAKINYLAFLTDASHHVFYPLPGAAMLPCVLAPFFVLGSVLLLARARDPRYAMLAAFFWLVLIINGVVTNDPPQPHRLLPALLPALVGVALALGWVVDVARSIRVPILQGAVFLGALSVVLVAAYLECAFYFGPAAQARPWEDTTVQARYVAQLAPTHRFLYVGAPPPGYPIHGTTRFLARDLKAEITHNPVLSLPAPTPADRDLAILVFPNAQEYLPLYRAAYPGARTELVQGHDGTTFVTALLVPREELTRWQGLVAQYPDGQRLETDPGQLGGGASAYPATVTWSGSLYIDRAGPYAFSTEGVPLQVAVDGAPLSTGQQHHLAVGWHALELKGSLTGPQARAALKWQPPGQQPAVIPTRALDARSLIGNLQCRIEFEGGHVTSRRDRAIGFQNIGEIVGTSASATLTWEGTLSVRTSGQYDFVLKSTSEAEFIIDGGSVVMSRAQGRACQLASGSAVLAVGLHSFTIRYKYEPSGTQGVLEWLWTPPGGETSIVPPAVLGPRGP